MAAAKGSRKIVSAADAVALIGDVVVNLGIGMPEGVAAEEGLLRHVTLTAEPGVIGGQPASRLDFGAAVDTDAVIPQNNQFDFYDGGGLDMTCLGMAQADATGNVNVSRFGMRLSGAGGFINISQNARAVVFAGTFTAGGLDVSASEDGIEIRQEGTSRKFLESVELITFAGARAARLGQPVLYATERRVFELTPQGLKLVEAAPGVDVERDIIGQMNVRTLVEEVRLMDSRIFRDREMDLRTDLLHLDLPDRIALDRGAVRLFLNFEKMRVRSRNEVDRVGQLAARTCAPLGGRVDVIVNHDGFRIDDSVEADRARMVGELTERYYRNVYRHSGSAFMRMKLREAFPDARTHFFETGEQARAFLDAQ